MGVERERRGRDRRRERERWEVEGSSPCQSLFYRFSDSLLLLLLLSFLLSFLLSLLLSLLLSPSSVARSNEPTKVTTHLGKMFSAINTLQLTVTDDPTAEGGQMTTAHAMSSKEGEVVVFADGGLALVGGVKEWLGQVESRMGGTLESLVGEALGALALVADGEVVGWIGAYPAQVLVVASQLAWAGWVEAALDGQSAPPPTAPTAPTPPTAPTSPLAAVLATLESRLRTLSTSVLHDLPPQLRHKCEHILTEMVHQRDVTRGLLADKATGKSDFAWVYHLRFYWSEKAADRSQRLSVKMANASFFYGFEYQGLGDRLVQTPLTDRCYLTLTQALHFRMGANPFGPAGTGKTETVKMLGSQLGRFVLVFNCDSSFDYAAMGRIFAGLCQVGAWGCFDEFNRLEERVLSAVSQQILTIQRGLMAHQEHIELLGMPCKLRPEVGIFVTLNPGYAGRSNLPDNLKQLFRAVAMVVPDRKMIAQVMLFSQGIVSAEALAGKVVLLFTLCAEQLSPQSHYDFGLRALKSVLVGAGALKRAADAPTQPTQPTPPTDDAQDAQDTQTRECGVLIKSMCDSLLPKLVAEDIPLFTALLRAVFPQSSLPDADDAGECWVHCCLPLLCVLSLSDAVTVSALTCTRFILVLVSYFVTFS